MGKRLFMTISSLTLGRCNMMNTVMKNENGFALIAGLMLLIVLTVIGAFATRSSVIELQIAGNERLATQEFLLADGVWQLGGVWLEKKRFAPDSANPNKSGDDRKFVRNYGGDKDMLNEEFDGNNDGLSQGLPYYYRLKRLKDERVEGYEDNYKDFYYRVDSNANKRVDISTRITKIYKVGY